MEGFHFALELGCPWLSGDSSGCTVQYIVTPSADRELGLQVTRKIEQIFVFVLRHQQFPVVCVPTSFSGRAGRKFMKYILSTCNLVGIGTFSPTTTTFFYERRLAHHISQPFLAK
jgi:hypothetical protein